MKPKLTQIIPIQKQNTNKNNKTNIVEYKKWNTELYEQNIEL